MEVAPIPLPKDVCARELGDLSGTYAGRLTHGDSKQADSYLHTRNYNESVEDAAIDQPVIGTPGQTKTEEVLENKQTCKSFNGNFSY